MTDIYFNKEQVISNDFPNQTVNNLYTAHRE